MASPNVLKLLLLAGSTMINLLGEPKRPELTDVYWGPGDEPKYIDTSIRDFNIRFSSEMINDLRFRLQNTRQSEPSLENSQWEYGVNSQSMPSIIDYWLNNYDFKQAEERLNQYPHFTTNIQGLNIHYIHVKPKLPEGSSIKVYPILIEHGWPSSPREFYKIIPILTTPRADRDFVFEVIAPSLPGFGFSDGAAKVGFSAVNIAHLLKNLMIRIGFDKWYIQAGDWGALVTSHMAALYPEHVLGVHSNYCLVLHPKSLLKLAIYSLFPSMLSEEDRKVISPPLNFTRTLLETTGFMHQQATKPDTLGVGMSDSPAALAAWILEKFSGLTNYAYKHREDGGLLEKFTMDELIDNLMFYWVPNKATSSFRIYAQTFSSNALSKNVDGLPIEVPSACAQYPFDTIAMPEKVLRDRYVNLVHRKIMPRGGHFAALEEPQLFADDVFEAVAKMNTKQDKTSKTSHSSEINLPFGLKLPKLPSFHF